MKLKHIGFAAVSLLLVLPLACDHSTTTPTSSSGGGGGNTGSGATTIMVSTAPSSSSSTGYIYTSSSGSNGSGGVLSITAHVGNVIALPGNTTHPLYFDAGSSTCIYSGSTSSQTYTFNSTGTYYFHCGNHASGCSGGNGACGSTNCSAMAGIVTVN